MTILLASTKWSRWRAESRRLSRDNLNKKIIIKIFIEEIGYERVYKTKLV